MADPTPPRARFAFPALRFDHACFGCGDANPIGLRLRFATTSDGVSASFLPEPAHQGFDAIVHGGIIAAVLDEAMAWATATAGVWTVTAEMSVRFRLPLSVGQPTTVTGRVTENRGRIVASAAELVRNSDSACIANATATFVRVRDAQAREWERRYVSSPRRPDTPASQRSNVDDRRRQEDQ